MIAEDCSLDFGLLLQGTPIKCMKWSDVLKYCMLLKHYIEQVAIALLGKWESKMVVDQVNKEQCNRTQGILLISSYWSGFLPDS